MLCASVRPRVLVVEDNALVAESLRSVLGSEGYHVVATVDRVRRALDVARCHPFDVLVTDLELAGRRDGIDGAIALQALQSVPVVLLTAALRSIHRTRVEGLPHSLLLTKPTSAEALLVAVTQVLASASSAARSADIALPPEAAAEQTTAGAVA